MNALHPARLSIEHRAGSSRMHLHKMRHYDFSNMRSVALSPERLASYDCVLIATDHTSYDYDAIARDAKLVVDTRNATRRVKQNREKIVNC